MENHRLNYMNGGCVTCRFAERDNRNRFVTMCAGFSNCSYEKFEGEVDISEEAKDAKIKELTKENEKLKQQLAEKDKRIKELKGKHTVVIPARMNGKTRLCYYNLLKIQNEQAIEELEKLRETLPEKNSPIYPITILKQIDKQLYELRGGDYVKNV